MTMKKHLYRILLPGLTLFLFSCQEKQAGIPDRPDYNLETFWFSAAHDHRADVFYIVPTCVRNWEKEGKTFYHADPRNLRHRQALLENMEKGREIFGDSCNFFSPYYRQITLESWAIGNSDSLIESRFATAREDILSAFDYYMENINQGRPFILAGFSQGGKSVVEILKRLDRKEQENLIAAYVIGYKITPEEAKLYPQRIRPAQDSIDVGVTICYNSAASPESLPEVLKPSGYCINPLNWQTSPAPATLYKGVSVGCDTALHYLKVEGLDTEKYHDPSLSFLFPKGCYHLWELDFYKNSLKKNVLQRFRQYRKAQRQL